MSCLEHECRECGHLEMNNEATPFCPECGGRTMTFFDEAPEWEPEEPDYDDEREEAEA